MKQIKIFLILSLILVIISSCNITTTLYYWGGKTGMDSYTSKYEQLSYDMYKKQTPEVLCSMLCVYEDMVKSPAGQRQVPPPGICAEYAYYLSLPETAETFATHATDGQKRTYKESDYATFFPQYAKQLFEKEMSLYPESVHFIKPLIEKLLQ